MAVDCVSMHGLLAPVSFLTRRETDVLGPRVMRPQKKHQIGCPGMRILQGNNTQANGSRLVSKIGIKDWYQTLH